ncbi:MAG: histidine kinase dimerization/phospho-acceptor domain-containing protein, partial [Ornithinimicrobium sp.]
MPPLPGTERPLDPVASIRVKIGLLVALSIVAAVVMLQVGSGAGVPGWLTIPVTLAAALGVTLWLARGMTSPLREMTRAAGQMASGDYSGQVVATSADEVGLLARAFNTMATELASADQQRRQLLATVSHELRTPLAGQRAVLENLVDGVISADDAALQAALDQSERLSALVEDLLDVSRVDGGAVALDVAPAGVADLVAAGIAEASVSNRDVVLESSVEPPDLSVEVDVARLAQVVANLLDNAIRHSPP